MGNRALAGFLRHLRTGWTRNRRRLARPVRNGVSITLCLLLVMSNFVHAQGVIADGTTATAVAVSGDVTDVTTSTFLDQNAFNSFERFSIDTGKTVNLHVPSSALNLLNLVHSDTSYISGTLNSIKDGTIGGNVFFLNPHGIVVSADGVVNVGSFTAITPIQGFMDSFFEAAGVPSSGAVSAVLGGTVPVSANGLITVQGRINAIGDIALSAGEIANSGTIASGAVFQVNEADFSDVVNIGGLVGGTSVSTENGDIMIKAVGDVTNSGNIATDGAPNLDAGEITIEAGRYITVDSGTIFALGVGADSTGGNISLVAEKTDHVDNRAAGADTGIYLSDATIIGRDITLTASSDAQYELNSKNPVLGDVSTKIGHLLGADVVIAQASATSEVVVGGGSLLEATGDVAVVASSAATAKTTMKDENDRELSVSFVYGEISSDAAVDIQSGATVRSSNLSMAAKNAGTLDIKVQSISEKGKLLGAVGVTAAEISSLAQIGSGADVQVSGAVTVSAVNENSFSTSVAAKANKDGLAGIAGAVFTASTDARALSDADLIGLKNVAVEAVDDTKKNSAIASSVASTESEDPDGQEPEKTTVGPEHVGTDFIKDKTDSKAPETDEKSGSTDGLKIAGTVTIVETDHSSLARIGDSASVDAADDIVVAAQTRNYGLQNKAESSVQAKDDSDPADVSLSAAIAYGDYNRNARAYIGADSQIQAQRVAIDSEVVMPYGIDELIDIEIDFDKYSDISYITDKMSEIKGKLGTPFLTGYANATETTGRIGVAGSLSYLDFTNDSQAYLGEGAVVTLRAGENSAWDAVTPAGRGLAWDAPLSISAATRHKGIYAAGNFNFSFKGTSGEAGSASVGGAYNQVNHTTTTRAYIAAGARIDQSGAPAKDVSVSAITEELVIALGPTSGRGGSYGLNGMFSLSTIDSATEASISSEADVTARDLKITALEDVISWALTGAFNMSESAGVGVSISINDVSTDTKAFIGPNSDDGSDEDGVPPGKIEARRAEIQAATDGRIESLSVAGAVASSSQSESDTSGGLLDDTDDKVSGALGKAEGKTEDPDKADGGSSGGYGGQPGSDPQTEPKFGLGVSGSSSVDLANLHTEAYVYQGDLRLAGDGTALKVQAINDTHITAVSGAAALARANNQSSEWSAAIAGSVALNVLGNSTSAFVRDSSVAGAQEVDVHALASGQQVAIALGVAINASADQDSAASAAGSVSVNTVENSVVAAVEDSTIVGQAVGPDRELDVVAYDRTKIGTGGGSLIAGGKGGVGAAITYSSIANTISASLAGTTISDYDDLRVHGLTASMIVSGGAMAGFTKGEETGTFGGSIVISTIGNATTAQISDSSDVAVSNDIDVVARDTKGVEELDDIIDGRQSDLVPDALDFSLSEFLLDYQPPDGTSIVSVAGVIQAGGNNVGISFAWNEVNSDFKALVSDSTLSAGGDVGVEAYSSALIAGLSVGVGLSSGKFAAAGSVTVNETGNPLTSGNNITAEVLGATIGADSIRVDAGDKTRIYSLAGQVTASLGKASVGAAIAHNLISNRVRSRLKESDVRVVGQLEVSALNDSAIGTLSAAGGGAPSFALNLSVSSAHIRNTTTAEVAGTGKLEAHQVSVSAEDESEITALSGGATFSGSTAVGGAVSFSDISNATRARISASSLDIRPSVPVADGLLLVQASNDSIVRVLGIAAGGASSAAVTGALTGSAVTNTTEAEVWDSTLDIDSGDIFVIAADTSEIEGLAATIAGAGSAAVGGAAFGSAIANTTRARMGGSEVSTTGSLQIYAENEATIWAGSAAGGGSGSASVTGSATTSVITNTTEALVEDTELSVVGFTGICARDGSEINTLAGNVSLSGAAAVGGAVTVNTVINTTRASLSNSNSENVEVGSLALMAINGSKILSGAVGAGGSGSAAVTGSVTTSVIKNTTEAELQGARFDQATDSVRVAADDRSDIQSLAGNAGAAGSAAVGGAIAVNAIANTTNALISDSLLDVRGETLVQAVNGSTIQTIGVSAAFSGACAITGSVATSHIMNTTEAEILDSEIEDSGRGNSRVGVLVRDAARIQSISGAAAASGAASVGAAASTNRIANTTKARISGGKVDDVGDLIVAGISEGTIESLAVGLGADVSVGVAGSVAVNLMDSNTESYIDAGAKVLARNNAGVVAENHDVVRNAAGATGIGIGIAGVGASAAVNQIGGSTRAYISGADTEVTALGLDPNRTLTVAEGSLDGPIDLGEAFFDDQDGAGVDFDEVETLVVSDLEGRRKTKNVSGVAVNASSTRSIQNAVANVGGGLFAGVAGTASVNVITAETEAYVNGSKINTTLPDHAGNGQSFDVTASDHAYGLSIIGTIGAGGVGVGAGVDTAVFAGSTRAYVDGSAEVRAKDAVVIDAQSTQSAASFAVSGGAGLVGVAGTGAVEVFAATTEAYLESAVVNSGSLSVDAKHDSRLLIGAGGFAAGGAALGATFTVASDSSTTRAYIDSSTVHADDGIDVSAEGNLEIYNLAASGALGGAASVAGSALVSLSSNTTEAYAKSSVLGTSGQRADHVSISARDRVTIANFAGAAGASLLGIGVGASAAVTRIDNTTSAYVEGSTVYVDGDVTVDALAERDLSDVAVSAGVGASVGIGGTAVVTQVGRALSGDVVSELDKDGSGTLTALDGFSRGDRLVTEGDDANAETGDTVAPKRTNTVANEDEIEGISDLFDDIWGRVDDETKDTTVTTGLTDEDFDAVNDAGRVSAADSLHDEALTGRTAALVVDSAIIANQDVRIGAAEKIEASIDSGALAGGIGAGIGGSVAVMDVNLNVEASVLGTSTVRSEQGEIEISAVAGRLSADAAAVSVNTYQGSAGIVGLGAAVSVADLTSNVTAQVEPESSLMTGAASAGDEDQRLTVRADDATDVYAEASGAAAGVVAAGMVSATAHKGGSTLASIDAGDISVGSGLLLLASNRTGGVHSHSLAGAGGVVSGAGSSALALEDGKVGAAIGDDVTVTGSNASVKIEAASEPRVSAYASGVGGGAAMVGASLADAGVSTSIQASIGARVSIDSKNLEVSAKTSLAQSQPMVQSYAGASGLGMLLGVNATVSSATNAIQVGSHVGSNSTLNVSGLTLVDARADTKQLSTATSDNVGCVAAGANSASASSDTNVSASLGDRVTVIGGTLSIKADGVDYNYTESVAGSGGVVSGSASSSHTKTTGTTEAYLGARVNVTGVERLELTARHTSGFNGRSDSTSAAVVGASGARVSNIVDYDVEARVGDQAVVKGQTLSIDAASYVVKDWLPGQAYNIQSGSGGVLDAAAVKSETGISNNARVAIGADARLEVEGDRKNPGILLINALSDIEAYDKVKLDAGGGISVALAESRIVSGHNDASVEIGPRARLESVGDVDVSVLSNANIETSTNVKTYGGAGAAWGESQSSAVVHSWIDIGADAFMLAYGDINLRVGSDRLGNSNDFRIQANTDLWNKTIAPIKTKPEADAYLSQTNLISLGSGSSLRTVGHIRLLTDKGTRDVKGYGVGKDLYREALEAIGQFFSDLIGGGDLSLEIKGGSSTDVASTGVRVDGTVEVGIENQRYLVIKEDGTIDAEHSSEGITITKTEEELSNSIQERLDELDDLIAAVEDCNTDDPSVNPWIGQEIADLSVEKEGLADEQGRLQGLTNEIQDLNDEHDTNQTKLGTNEGLISDYQQELEGLDPDDPNDQPQIAHLEGEITKLENENVTLQARLDEIDETLINYSQHSDDFEARLDEIPGLIAAIESRIGELQSILDELSGDGTSDVNGLLGAYYAEKAMLQAQLAGLGGSISTVGVITINEGITARSSNIYINAGSLTGGGELLAPGDTRIEVTNKSPYFLRTNELTIPDEAGGRIYVNSVSVTGNDEINFRNLFGGSGERADFTNILTADNTIPVIKVVNSYLPDPGDRAPDLFIDANVRNLHGLAEITSTYGSVQIKDGVDVVAETIKITAGRDVFIGYKDGFRNIGGDIRARWQDVVDSAEARERSSSDNRTAEQILGIHGPYDPSILAGNNVFISGQYLNINGVIQSGLPMRTVEISESVATEIAAYRQKYLSGEVTDPLYKGLSVNSGIEDDISRIPVYYNAEHDRLELAPVETMGGYMELYGHIMNTSVGELRVMDGYATIDIDNKTSTPLLLSTISTGSGIEGTIRITDTGKSFSVGGHTTPLVTVIKRAGDSVFEYNNQNHTGTLDMANPVNTTAGRLTQYQPLENQYYSWTILTETTWREEKYRYKTTWFGLFKDTTKFSWGSVSRHQQGDPVVINPGVVRQIDPSKHDETYWYDRSVWVDHSGWNEGNWSTECNYLLYKKEKQLWDRTAYETILHNHNIAADNPIKISFLGSDTGLLSVESKGDIIIDGQLKNTAGNTLLRTEGAIRQGSSEWARIIGQDVELEAQTGIGDADRSVTTDLVDSGLITAHASQGDIYLEEMKGDLVFAQITAADGDIVLTAETSIVGLDTDSLIDGNKVSLVAHHGHIGTETAMVRIDTEAEESGGLGASAAGDIYIREVNGDLYIEKVESLGGSVVVQADAGSIIDNNDARTEDTRAMDELLGLWDAMALTGEKAEESANQSVAAYERMRQREYRTYWQYRNRLVDEDGRVLPYDPTATIALSAVEVAYYHDELGWSDQEIDSLQNRMTDEYHSLNQLYGSVSDSYDDGWAYVVSKPVDAHGAPIYDPDEYDPAVYAEWNSLVAGASWTEEQLRNSIGIGVLKEVSDTRIWIEDPNVVGRDLELAASGSIGSVSPEQFTVNIDGRKWSDLSDVEKLMILSAERKDITFVSEHEISIEIRDAVDIEATGKVSASAAGSIDLGSEVDINLNSVTSADRSDIRIKSRQSINNAADPGIANVVGGDAIFEAARGSIGQEGSAILLDLGSASLTARAGDDIYVRSNHHDLNIDTMYATYHVNLVSLQSILNATNPDINIRAESLHMEAGASIGSDTQLLKVGLDPTGKLSANVLGDIFVSSSLHSLRTGGVTASGNITLFGGDDVYAESVDGGISTQFGNVLIDAAGSILTGDEGGDSCITAENIYMVVGGSIGSIEDDLRTDVLSLGRLRIEGGGGVYLTEVAGNMNLDTVSSSSGNVRLSAQTGDISLGRVSATSGTVTLTAQGSILGSSDVSGSDIDAVNISLVAETGSIGAAADHLRVDSSNAAAGAASARAVEGVYLTEVDGDLNVIRIESTAGDINVIADGSILNANAGDSAGDPNSSSDMANFEGDTITLTSHSGGIGEAAASVTTAAAGKTGVRADSDIYVTEATGDMDLDTASSSSGNVSLKAQSGDILLGRVSATSGTVTMTAHGSIMGSSDVLDSDIDAVNIHLIAETGSIGAAADHLRVDSSNAAAGAVSASAVEGIYLTEVDGDLNVTRIESTTGDINVIADGSIFNANASDSAGDGDSVGSMVNFEGDTITLTSHSGGIGEAASRVVTAAAGKTGVRADSDIYVTEATGDMDLDTASSSSGDVSLKAQSGDILLGRVSATSGTVTLTAQGSIVGSSGASDSDIDAVSIDLVAETGSIGAAGDLLRVDSSNATAGAVSARAVDGVYVTEAEGDMALHTVSSARGDVSLKAQSGDILLGRVSATSGTVTLTAQGSILGSSDVSGSDIDAVSISLVAETGSIGAAADHLRVDSSNAAAGAASARAVEGVYLTEVDGDLNVTRIESTTGDINVIADGSILNANASGSEGDSAGDGDSVGSMVNFKGDTITLTSHSGGIGEAASRVVTAADGKTDVWADLDVYLEERGGDLDSDYVASEHGSIDVLVSGESARIKELRAAGSFALESLQSAALEEVVASQVTVILTAAASSLYVAEASVADVVTARADDIEFASLMHTGLEPLKLSIVGGSGNMADNVVVHARSDLGIVFERLEADFSLIDAQVDDLAFLHTVVGSRADIYNRYHKVIADNQIWQLFDCHLQLRPENDPFYLFMSDHRKMMTDAPIVNYDDNYIINDYSSENSLVRMAEKLTVTAGAKSDWFMDYYESALLTSLGSGRTSVILSTSDSGVVQTEQPRDDDENTLH